jgi:multicomponent Na+:H+ antiporter subunit F
LVRAWKGPNLVDRIIALDLVLLMLAGGLAAEAARTGSQFYVAAVIVVALIAFAGTILVARFVEWRDVP